MRCGLQLCQWMPVVALLVVGCEKRAVSPGADASAQLDGGRPALPLLQVRLSFVAQDGGVIEETLSTDTPGVLEPETRRLVVETNQALRNVRIRLFDELDKVVPSEDSMEEMADRVRDTLDLSAPLKAGHRYLLTFDGQTGASMLDAQGKPLSDHRYPLQVTGEREKEKPAKPAKRTKTTRRHKKRG